MGDFDTPSLLICHQIRYSLVTDVLGQIAVFIIYLSLATETRA